MIYNDLKKLDIKDRLIYLFSALSFILGWAITFLGFYAPPKGVVDNTVIVIFGQAMIFAGCGFGLTQYVEYQITKTQSKIIDKLTKKDDKSTTDKEL